MKNTDLYIFLLFILCSCSLFSQQITSDSSLQPIQLIQNLVGENCVSASNISSPINGSIDNITSYGSFQRGSSNFPLESGLILSTGHVNSAGNVILSDNLSEGTIEWQTDPDILDILGIDQTLNATSIEFDLVAANNFIAFKYLFASDEYQQEYPCDFKDVFAILIKRTGTNDPYTNIAVVPNTQTEISTNTIRPAIGEFCNALNEDYFQGYNLGATNYNGRTTVLTATTAVVPGDTYTIKFVIADHIDERFDSAVFIEADSFGGAVDLGPDQSICGNALVLDGDINTPGATYSWSLNNTVIAGQTNPTLQVTQSGTYDLEITIPLANGSCVLSDTINIEIIPFQEAEPIADIIECDPAPSDGIIDIDLTLKNDEIYDNLPSTNYSISYHNTSEDAQNNTNPITGIYQNTEQFETIYFRIESLDDTCLQIGAFDLIVNISPNTLEIDPLAVCDGVLNIDGLFVENLSYLDFSVANFEFNRTVTYHLTEDEAINNENPISTTTEIIGDPPYFVARVIDNFGGCFSIVRINLDYQASPDLGIDSFVFDLCFDKNYYEWTPTETFDYNTKVLSYNLLDYLDELEQQYPGFTFRILVFGLPTPPIINTASTVITLPLGVSSGDYCEVVINLEIHKNLSFNILGDNTIVNRCDDPSIIGSEAIDLNGVTDEVLRGYDDITITYYATQQDQENATNPIDTNTPFVVNEPSTLIYVKTQFKDACENFSTITLQLNDVPVIESRFADACGNFNAQDGTTAIDLRSFQSLMIQGTPEGQVKFYDSLINAQLDENEITDFYDVAGGSQQFFVRVINGITQCYTITTLDINVAESLDFQSPEPIILCDDDQDGFVTINLRDVLPSISSDIEDFRAKFFTSYDNAFEGTAQISDPENFSATTQNIFLRLERETLNCFAIVDFEVKVFDNPQIDNITDFINCQTQGSNVADFIFEERDDTILNGQIGMEIFYFESEAEAIDNNNAINKTVPYQNTSNPQTIYVRIENQSEDGCAAVAPMQIEVRQAPIYNPPSDIPICGTNGNGPYLVDLSEKITEIANASPHNLNITFHTTALNANLGTNPASLSYTSTSNPELIYTRILNIDSGCYTIETFNINILDLPEVNLGQSLTVCANNFDTNLTWNLTDIELDILDGRQFNVDFTYYNSEADAIADSNPIAEPENYANISNSETIYAKLTNATTGCFSLVPFELNINMPPAINNFEVYDVCDNQANSVDLLDINTVLLETSFNVLVSYHQNLADAEANINPLDTNYTYTATSETLYARVAFSTTGCYAVYPFILRVNPRPIANQPNDLVACDDDDDGFYAFDLSNQNTVILNGQDPNIYVVDYYNTLEDAMDGLESLNPIYNAYDGEQIFFRVTNTLTGCFDSNQFTCIVNPLPLVSIEDQVICLNSLPLIVSAQTEDTSHTYLWSTNETTSEIEITEVGTYSVTVTNGSGCQNTSTFNVTESESATIEVVETIDFSDPNNITVTVNGIGDYLYSLNNGPQQLSNVFENVPIGYNTVTIIDQNGCDRITKEVLVVDTPKHMTPNNDGAFDTWHITGIETLPGTIIKIFDRYGKLLKTLTANTPGWDGTYNGTPMPSGDYWYTAEVMRDGETFQINGHFSLRR